MLAAQKLIAEAMAQYGLDGRAYEYDPKFNWVVVWQIRYEHGYPMGMTKLCTWKAKAK